MFDQLDVQTDVSFIDSLSKEVKEAKSLSNYYNFREMGYNLPIGSRHQKLIQFNLGKNYNLYYRKPWDFLDVISYVGGLANILFLVFFYIASFFSSKLYLEKLLHQFYYINPLPKNNPQEKGEKGEKGSFSLIKRFNTFFSKSFLKWYDFFPLLLHQKSKISAELP